MSARPPLAIRMLARANWPACPVRTVRLGAAGKDVLVLIGPGHPMWLPVDGRFAAARADQRPAGSGEEAGWQADGLAWCNGCQGEGCVLQEPQERTPGSTWLSLIGRSAAGFAWPRDSGRRNGCHPLSSGSPIFRQRPHHLLVPRLSRQAPVMPGSLPSSWPFAPGDVIGLLPLESPGASPAAPRAADPRLGDDPRTGGLVSRTGRPYFVAYQRSSPRHMAGPVRRGWPAEADSSSPSGARSQ